MSGLTLTRPRTLQGGRRTLHAGAKRIDEDAKILVLNSTTLDEEGVLKGR